MATARNDEGPTGQPARQLLPSSAVVTRRLLHLNAGANAACATTCDDRVGLAAVRVVDTGVDVVLGGEAEVVETTGAGEVATCACAPLLQADNVPMAMSAAAAAVILRIPLA